MSSYPTRKIGSDQVSAIGFGAMGIAAFYGKPEPDEERLKVSGGCYTHPCILRMPGADLL